jgi:hypothetical protein
VGLTWVQQQQDAFFSEMGKAKIKIKDEREKA